MSTLRNLHNAPNCKQQAGKRQQTAERCVDREVAESHWVTDASHTQKEGDRGGH